MRLFAEANIRLCYTGSNFDEVLPVSTRAASKHDFSG